METLGMLSVLLVFGGGIGALIMFFSVIMIEHRLGKIQKMLEKSLPKGQALQHTSDQTAIISEQMYILLERGQKNGNSETEDSKGEQG